MAWGLPRSGGTKEGWSAALGEAAGLAQACVFRMCWGLDAGALLKDKMGCWGEAGVGSSWLPGKDLSRK